MARKTSFQIEKNDIFGELLHILSDFSSKRIVLNGKYSSWTNVHVGDPQGSILGPIFFSIYIKDFSEKLITNEKQFADDI